MPYADPEAQREYQRLWRAKRRSDYLADKCCALCGSTDALEIDHIDPKTKISHRVWSWSEKKRAAELAKCQVLCGPHHLEKTIRYYEENRKHGRTGYRHGCRCPVCKEAQRVHNAQRFMPQV